MPKFVPRERKHKKLARQKDAEQSIHDAASKAAGANTDHEQLLSKKAALKQELATPAMSSKKRKRLDKYIENKLRREETLALIKRLEQRQKDGLDRSALMSAKVLGRRGDAKNDRKKSRRVEEESAGESEESEEDERDQFEVPNARKDEKLDGDESVSPVAPPSKQEADPGFGSGLKRPLELDENGRPIIKSRKRKRTGPLIFDRLPVQEFEHAEWTGFSDDEMSTNADGDVDSEGENSATESEEVMMAASDASGETQTDDDMEDTSSEGDPEDSESSSTSKVARKARTSAFKAWAEQERNKTIGFTPSTATQLQLPVIPEEIKNSFVPRPIEQDPLPEGFTQQSEIAKDRRAYSVPVQRTDEIQTKRMALPVVAEEQRIMEAIFNNDVVIVSGATGSGKTTQVPQFMFEHGFGSPDGPTPGIIGVTQPRRVAAVSVAKRVGDELGDMGKRVAYQIRFDSTVRSGTAIKFMTDGILLREMTEDFSLKKYSAIIIDEAHERTVNTDILIALMSRCVKIRRELSLAQPKVYKPLKLVIMSATLRVEDFRANSRLFSQPPPLLEVEGRQYDVKVHWARRTSHDFVDEAFKKVSRGHRKLPHGGMLVFLTGQNDIRLLMQRLRDVFQTTDEKKKPESKRKVDTKDNAVEEEELEELGAVHDDTQLDIDEDSVEAANEEETAEPDDPDAEFIIEGEEPASEIMKIHVLPLYSQLPSKEQLRVFEAPPAGSRLIILATDIAETSLTIPGIRYVFDCGRHKERTWDRAGVQTFRTSWISKASADQRMGRAGRTGPGHCYRLYSSAIFESAMPEFAQPEIFRSPLEGVVLQLKSMNIGRVDNFPFPTPPVKGSIVKAEKLLMNLGALDGKGRITKLGRELQNYPLNPRFAQMLRLGVAHGCAKEVIALVAALDVPELMIPESQLDLKTPVKAQDEIWTAEDDLAESTRQTNRNAYAAAQARLSRLDFNKNKVVPQSDALKLFAAMLDFSSTPADQKEEFCKTNFIREKGLREADQLRKQLFNIVRNLHPHVAGNLQQDTLKKPSEKTTALMKQITAAGFVDQVAIRSDLLPVPPIEEKKAKRAIDVKYKTLFSSSSRDGEPSESDDGFVYVHPSSLLARLPTNCMPRYIIYHRLQRSQPSQPGATSRVRMAPLTPVSAEQLASLAKGTGLLEIGKPLGKLEVLPSNEKGEERRECEVMLSLVGDKGMVGWPLVRKKVVQRRDPAEGWVVDVWKS
ncbi:uncharacterized protein PV09_09200 [Verruconis gallopava]|uniref:RNA helicase n=1 Tax=Verruconis gallopava TaxID=253628 RepID=A0A0D1ZXC8_9PEZI|nr:uncharacterized protein PV09_09200 [Verruconis gallopava]KIV99102.1 hypothetical protein PV09_09200 [Verruconis gallopava]